MRHSDNCGSRSGPHTYDTHGDKIRTVQCIAAGTSSRTSLFFTRDERLLVTPGYEFRPYLFVSFRPARALRG